MKFVDEKIVIEENRSQVIFDKIPNFVDSTIRQKKAILLKRAACLQYVFAYFGGKRVESEIELIFEGDGAKAEILGVIYGQGENKLNLKTTSLHKVPNTGSEVFLKGVLKDRAQLDYCGLIKIEKKAQKTNSYLSDHILILSKEAKAVAIPSLEIEADDVKASHAATVGRIDEEQVFYLMSRGLSTKAVEKMIVQGFLSSVVEKIVDPNIREKIVSEIEKIKL